MGHLLGQCVAECSWQCLQTEVEREIFENREEKKIGEIAGEIENWRERFPRACADSNASNLIDLEADEIVALKYDVMRICMNSELRELHLSEFCKDDDLFWRDCKSNDFDFSANMRNRSFTVR